MKRPRVNLGNWLILLGLLTAVSASFSYLNLDLAALLQGDSPAQMARFAQGFLPPDLSAPLLQQVARGALETLASQPSAPCWRRSWACCWPCPLPVVSAPWPRA